MNRDSKSTFDEIAAQKGEEAAIQAGIEADPDAYELDADWFRHASPAREMMPHVRASYSWINADNRTDFQLIVDKMLVASGHVSVNRDLFTVTSELDRKTHVFQTMRDAKNWAVEHFDIHHALEDPPGDSTSRAYYTWASSEDRTNFQLFVDGSPIAKGRVSERRDLFTVASRPEGTTRSFRTMRAAKSWAISLFDSRRSTAHTPDSSDLRSSFAWISYKDRENFRLFVEGMLVAEGQVLERHRLVSIFSRLDETRHSFSTLTEAKKWAIEHYRSVSPAIERELIPNSQ
ncbi:MAG: hypothetical protein F4Y42_11990 [Caldilineaceae bacterium SB0664_bin_27]|uniref:Uncharacterized protein n=1 Tax=Caldilineaceae bacterium SB0664_bin_27 TaxID=2605260 RepID=A0A6B0YTX2_9CHLR|nr:hypothetical protein [Caldilineaceae bacterium SB0664_bin_27]